MAKIQIRGVDASDPEPNNGNQELDLKNQPEADLEFWTWLESKNYPSLSMNVKSKNLRTEKRIFLFF